MSIGCSILNDSDDEYFGNLPLKEAFCSPLPSDSGIEVSNRLAGLTPRWAVALRNYEGKVKSSRPSLRETRGNSPDPLVYPTSACPEFHVGCWLG